MAHLGRLYPYLKQLDFSLRYFHPSYLALANRYVVDDGELIANDFNWNFDGVVSQPGEADYSLGHVMYRFIPAESDPPGMEYRFYYRVVDDIQYHYLTVEFWRQGVLIFEASNSLFFQSYTRFILGGHLNPVPPDPLKFAQFRGSINFVPWEP